MKAIPLTQGQVAVVDDDDFLWLTKWKWCAAWYSDTKSFYAMRMERAKNGKWRSISMHRQILGLEHGDKRQVDHINHKTLDNRRDNLRTVNHAENQWNQRIRSGYSWQRKTRKFQAQIQINKKKKHLGYFDTPEQAKEAYLAAKARYHVIGTDEVKRMET
jgi:hypothetical protein